MVALSLSDLKFPEWPQYGDEERVGLPSKLPCGVNVDHLVVLMRRDKKAAGGLAFVLDGPDGPDLVTGISEAAVSGTLMKMPRDNPS